MLSGRCFSLPLSAPLRQVNLDAKIDKSPRRFHWLVAEYNRHSVRQDTQIDGLDPTLAEAVAAASTGGSINWWQQVAHTHIHREFESKFEEA